MAPPGTLMRRALPIVCAVGVAAACAGGASASAASPDPAYSKQMQAVGAGLSTSLAAISAAAGVPFHYPVKPTAARDAARYLTKGHVSLVAVTSRLKAIKPPAAVATDHAKLMKATVQLNTEILPVIAKLRQGYLVAADKLLSLPGIKKVSAAVVALKKDGYSIGVT